VVPTAWVPPTGTRLPPPSPSPTALPESAATQYYTTQSGDTLPALAARFGVNPDDIEVPPGAPPLQGRTTLQAGQLLSIRSVLAEVGPAQRLLPDSEVVFSGAAAGFDAQAFVEEYGGYLARYQGYADGRPGLGGEVIGAAAVDHSVNPRLLVALLEYQSGWVTQARPAGDSLVYPYGWRHPYLQNLNAQLTWATSQLAIGYYGWRAGSLTELTFTDGSKLRLEPTQNAGTVAVHYFFSQVLDRPVWEQAVSSGGFLATYTALFGDPFARALDPLLPADLGQVPLTLPFEPGHTWYYSGGPHGAWEHGGAQAALDFAPASTSSGCVDSNEWVTAVAAGLVIRSGFGVVVLDLDGDGRETTGWNILYLHLADRGRVAQGTVVERGGRLGHPSCEGGRATGTHVHIARKFNGEWIPADSVVPFEMSGWAAVQGAGEYLGELRRGDQVVTACTCTAAWTGITLER
jgi:murein DD-endopeptidase MepM/ murein hydrolase activator NlpD